MLRFFFSLTLLKEIKFDFFFFLIVKKFFHNWAHRVPIYACKRNLIVGIGFDIFLELKYKLKSNRVRNRLSPNYPTENGGKKI